MERADLAGEVCGQIFDSRERLAVAVEPGGLEPVQGLIVAQVLRPGAVAEHIAVVSGDAKNGGACTPRLQWDDGPLLLGKGRGRAQECQDVVLPLLQLFAQFGGKHAGRRIAPQRVALRPDLNIAAAQVGQQGGHAHSSISTRLAARAGARREPVAHARASIASASPATVGRSKRWRSGRSSAEAIRSFAMSRAAMSEWPPKSKKLSNTPKSVRSSTSRNMPRTISSLGVRGATATPRVGRASPLGAGSALRSSLPLGVRGNASSLTKRAGTMYSGLAARTRARSWSSKSAGGVSTTRYATRRLSPGDRKSVV